MSKKNKKPQPAPLPRASQDITVEYNQLCAQLGNALIQFEIQKSQAIARFQQLNQEMVQATALEAAKAEQLQKSLESKGDQLINLVGEKVLHESK